MRIITALLLFIPLLVAAETDHQRSRLAVQAGEVLPLRQVLEQVEKSHPGQVLEVELDKKMRSQQEPFWVYEMKMLTEEGRLQRLLVDAKTGEVLGIKQRPNSKRKMNMNMREHKHAHPNR